MLSNLLHITGNVVEDPVLRTTATGTSVTNVRVASNEQRYNRATDQWETVNTSFYNVACWKKLGEHVASSMRRGDPVFFIGRPSVREFTRNNGSVDHSVEVNADVFAPDMHRVSVDVRRKRTEQTQTPADVAPTPQEQEDVDPWASNLGRTDEPLTAAEPAA